MFMLYAGVLIDNVVIFLAVGAGLVLWSYFWLPSAMLIATRAMFAWSFDRLVPEKLSEVHPKYNSPWVAVLVVAVIAEAFLLLYHIGVFKFLTPALAYYFVFWLVSLCGVVFPYLAKTRPLFEASPVNWRLAGIPVMSICGVFGLFYFTVGLYFMLTNDLLYLNSPQQLVTTGLQFAIPLVIFVVAREYRQRQGVPIDAAFREIPPSEPSIAIRASGRAMAELTIFYVADIHGSEVCFRKWLNAAAFYGADMLDHRRRPDRQDAAADLSGGRARSVAGPRPGRSENSASRARPSCRRAGPDGPQRRCLWVRHDARRGRRDPRFDRAGARDVRPAQGGGARGMAGARRRTAGRSADAAFVMPGNDDPPQIDAVLAGSRTLRDVQGRTTELAPGIWMASRGESTPTPWNTPRELPEADLGERVREAVDQLPSGGTTIWNLHMPPHDTRIDRAPRLGPGLAVQYDGSGEPIMDPVGSTTIRTLIAERQPTIALHGHIHEGRGRYRIGTTHGFNPAASTRTACSTACSCGCPTSTACGTSCSRRARSVAASALVRPSGGGPGRPPPTESGRPPAGP